ncbi:MAG TPA: TadE family protein [Candidatus Limnocylindrales bacterium]|nr:TadE family protein [Candidatus Limnocylindrales bacterium]
MRLRGNRPARGQSLVEFGLILPIFVLILVGLFDVGRAVYAYNTLNNAAREAGRLAIVDQFEDHVLDEAMKAASGVGVVRNEITVAYELPDGDPCPHVGDNQIVRCVAVVIVPYTYAAATPIIGNIIGEITIEGASRFPVSILCDAATCPYGS